MVSSNFLVIVTLLLQERKILAIGSGLSSVQSGSTYVSMEAEIPEVLYRGMRDFIGSNPNWDQYRVMSSALAHFLFQNGCEDRAVTERYLDDLFIQPES